MSAQLRTWLGVLGVLGVTLVASAWWVFASVQVPAVSTPPPTSTSQSPLASPVLDQLKARTVYGDLPVADPGESHRIDPFNK